MATLTRTDDLRGAEFVDPDLTGARFVGADPSGGVLSGVDIQRADIDSSWLLEDGGLRVVNGVDSVTTWLTLSSPSRRPLARARIPLVVVLLHVDDLRKPLPDRRRGRRQTGAAGHGDGVNRYGLGVRAM